MQQQPHIKDSDLSTEEARENVAPCQPPPDSETHDNQSPQDVGPWTDDRMRSEFLNEPAFGNLVSTVFHSAENV